MRPRNLMFALACCALTGALPAKAQNLAPNPSFQTDLSGWTTNILATHTIEWAAKDVRGSNVSGSLEVRELPANTVAAVFSDCFAVTAGDVLTWGASIAADGGVDGSARATIWFYSDPVCGGVNEVQSTTLRTDFPVSGWGESQGTGVVPAGAIRARLGLRVSSSSHPAAAVYFDNAFVYTGVSCVGTDRVTCLAKDRFRLSAVWQKPSGEKGWSRVVKLTGDSAYLWFFNASNIELVTKVLDACSFSERFWVFAAGLTNVGVEIVVTDTATGETWLHFNSLGDAFQPVQDTNAFATCSP